MNITHPLVRGRAVAAVEAGRRLADALPLEFGRLGLPAAASTLRRLEDGDVLAPQDEPVLEALLASLEAIVARETRGTRLALVPLGVSCDGEPTYGYEEVAALSPLGEEMSEHRDTLRALLRLRRSLLDQAAADRALRAIARA